MTAAKISRVKLSNLLGEKRNGKSVREFIREHQEFGITPHAWRAWESGETHPNSDNLLKLANLFGIPLEKLIKQIEEIDGEHVEYKFPLRPYNKKSEVVSQPNLSFLAEESIIASVLTSNEKATVIKRLLSQIEDKKKIFLELLKESDFDFFDIAEEYQNKIEIIKNMSSTIEKEEKIQLATFLLTEATIERG